MTIHRTEDPDRTPGRDRPAGLGGPPRRSVLRAGALTGIGLLAAACARIPTSSPVQQQQVGSGVVQDAPYVQPRLPVQGAGPEEIVLGFVQAGVGPEDDYGVARQYLAPSARSSWDPTAGVTIYPAGMELEVVRTSDVSARLTVQALAQVDARGVRTVLGAPSSREIDMRLETVDGQWRISSPPDGIFLSQAAFENLFTTARLYFLDPRAAHLVPDHRWFPVQQSAQKLLVQLGAGPSEVLAPAVRSAVPQLTELAEVTLVPGDDNTTQVELPRAIDDLPESQRDRALAQIQTSLRTLRGLSSVRVSIGGVVVDLSAGDLSRPLPGHRPIGAGTTGIISLADITAGAGAAQLVPALADDVVSSPAIAQSGPLAAALAADGGTLVLASTNGSIPRRDAALGGALVAPRVDDAGYVWTSPVTSAGALLALSGSGSASDARVDAPWLAGRELRALDLSADATRLIVLSADESVSRIDLCAVIRDAAGVPSALTSPVTLHTELGDVTQISWYDEIEVLVLGTAAQSGEQQVLVLNLLEGSEMMPAPRQGTLRVAGTAVSEVIWATTEAGALLRTNGTGWSTVDLPARDPSYY